MAKKKGGKQKKVVEGGQDAIANMFAALLLDSSDDDDWGAPAEAEVDPIAVMRAHRTLNVGPRAKTKRPAASVGQSKKKRGSKEHTPHATFPEEYAFRLRLPRLNDDALKEYPELWELITTPPETTAQLIEKEVALIALNWAQELLIGPQAAIAGATWSLGEIRPLEKKSAVFFELQRPPKREDEQPNGGHLRKGAIVRVVPADSAEDDGIPQAQVVRSNHKAVTIKVLLPAHKNLRKKLEKRLADRVDVYEVNSDFVAMAMLNSIERLQSGVCDHVLDPAPLFKRTLRQFERDFAEIQPALSAHTGLNEQQTRALYAICTSAHADAPFVLHGPPGTGKTRVIAATVCCLLEMNPDFRILLTAPSNMAADMIALKLRECYAPPIMTTNNVLRLRSTGNDFASRDRRLDPISSFDDNEGAFTIPTAEVLQEKRVIICTLGCSAHVVHRLAPGHFSHIFLDEAGQAAEGEIWIPIGGLATRTTSIVFCGDDRQPGPACTLNLGREVSEQFESPLVRYSNLPLYKTETRVLCQLNLSYRCHSSILSFPSETFYSGQLLSGTDGRHEPFVKWKGLSNRKFPLMFVSVDGKEVTQGRSHGNLEEVEVVLEYLHRLLDDFPQLEPEDIGVISPYRYQTHLLTTALMASDIRGKREITVDSVERFQGSERKVIILATTRTGGLGFLDCDKVEESYRLDSGVRRKPPMPTGPQKNGQPKAKKPTKTTPLLTPPSTSGQSTPSPVKPKKKKNKKKKAAPFTS